MELTRRDAMGALAAAGVAVGAGVVADRFANPGGDHAWDEHAVATTVAVARAIYPGELENVESFVRTYALTRSEDDDAYRDGMAVAVTELDDYAQTWEDARFVDLEPAAGRELLHSMGVDVEDPVPDGNAAERVRFYLVNELLYALFTTDTGGELVGIENPQGFPGGTDSYQRGPGQAGGTASSQHGPDQAGGGGP